MSFSSKKSGKPFSTLGDSLAFRDLLKGKVTTKDDDDK